MTKEPAKERIRKNFVLLLQSKEIHQIKVSQLCNLSGINRSTFYANYMDVYDLGEKVSSEIENKYIYMINLAQDSKKLKQAFFELFTDVKSNPKVYKAYFKINPSKALIFKEHAESDSDSQSKFLKYNSIFFRTGITSVVKLWLENDCMDSVEDMSVLIWNKYKF